MIRHTADDQCTVVDGRCVECGATHAAPCPLCNAAAYHRPGCVYGEAAELAIAVGGITPAAAAFNAEAEIAAQLDVGADLGVGPATAHLVAIDLRAPAAWPVLDPRAASLSRAELVAMPREQIDALLAGRAAAAVIESVVPVPPDLERRTLAAVHRAELDPPLRAAFAALACPCGYPATRTIHTGGELCPRDEPTAIAPVDDDREPTAAELAAAHAACAIDDAIVLERRDAAAELEAATVHGFGHADVTLRSLVSISSPPVAPGKSGAFVDLRVFVRPSDQQRGRLVEAHLHELAAAVLRDTAGDWPVSIVLAGDCRLRSGYVGRVVVELDQAERGAALAAVRAISALGSRPW